MHLKILPTVHLKGYGGAKCPIIIGDHLGLHFNFLCESTWDARSCNLTKPQKCVGLARAVFDASALANGAKTPAPNIGRNEFPLSCRFRKLSFLSQTVNKNLNFSMTVETLLSVEVTESF